jgi:hypothetical protein
MPSDFPEKIIFVKLKSHAHEMEIARFYRKRYSHDELSYMFFISAGTTLDLQTSLGPFKFVI